MLPGFAAGPLFGPVMGPDRRRVLLLRLGAGCLALLLHLPHRALPRCQCTSGRACVRYL